jgi:hypothetical protein
MFRRFFFTAGKPACVHPMLQGRHEAALAVLGRPLDGENFPKGVWAGVVCCG